MTDWHVGQMVVCIDGREKRSTNVRAWKEIGERPPIKGRIYTIAELWIDEVFDELRCTVEEYRFRVPFCNGERLGYGIFRFRPVKTTSIEVFRKLLVNIPQEELVTP